MIIDSPIISGSSSATGSLNQVGIVSITGSLFVNGLAVTGNTGSAESASYAGAYTLTSSFQNYTSSTDARIASINASTSSLNNYTSSTDAKIASINAFSASILNYTSSTDANITALYAFSSSLLSYTSSNNANITSLNSYTSSATARFVGLETATASFSGRIDGLELATASLNTYTSSATARFVGLETATSSLNSFTSSANTRLGTLEAATASLNNYTSSATARFVGLEAATASLNSYTSSNTANIVSLNSYTSSATARFVGLEAATSSLNTFTSSINSRVTVVESKYATTGSNTFTGCQYISNTTAPTGFSNTTAAVYTDGGLQVTKDSYFSSSLYIKGDLIVYGTQSVSYITSSALNISTNIISVNTATPSVRYGGLAVYDSGSTGLTGSLLWDSQNNHWLYSNPSGSSYSGGMLISGPRNTGSLGNEQGTTACMLLAGQGGDHLTSSAIYHDSATTCIPNALLASGCIGIGTSSPYSTLTVGNSDTTSVITPGGNNTHLTIKTLGAAGAFRVYSISGSTGNLATTESFRVDAGGNVGVGTTSPSVKLHVNGQQYLGTASTTTGQLYLFNSSNDTRFDILNNGTEFKLASTYLSTAGYMPITFYTGDTERMRIASTGIACFACQVCTPSLIANTITLSTTTADYAATITNVQDGSQGLLVRATDNDTTLNILNLQSSVGAVSQTWVDRFTITKAGNAGIGTSSPCSYASQTLHVNSPSGASTSIKVTNTTTTTGVACGLDILQSNSDTYIYNRSVGLIELGTSNAARLTISSAGVACFSNTVCVGGDLSVVSAGSTTALFDGTNPTLTLRRNNNGNASAAINFKGSSAVKWQMGTNQAIGLGFEINEGDATANRLYIAPGGIACFGGTVCMANTIFSTAGTATLVNTNITSTACFGATSRAGFTGIADNCNGVYFGMGADGTGISAGMGFFRESTGWNSALAFYTNCITDGVTVPRIQEKMRITSGGNVGIGTTNPSQKLTVTGIINSEENGDYYGVWIQGSCTAGKCSTIGLGPWYSQAGYIQWVDNDRLRIYTCSSGKNLTLQETGGNVGIGTSSPYQNLQVYQTGTAGNNYVEGTVQVGGTSATLGAALSYAAQNSGYVNLVNLNTSGGANARINLGFGAISSGLPASTVMVLNQSGNVGIGTTSPSEKLQIKGANTYNLISSCFKGDYGSGFAFSDNLGGFNYDAGANTFCIYSNYANYGGIIISTATNPRMFVSSCGVTCFSCQVCAPYIYVGRNAGGDTTNYSLSINRHGDLACSHAYTTVPAFIISELSNAGPTSGVVDTNGIWNLSFGRYSHTMACAKFASLMFIGYDGAMGPLRVDGRGNMFVGYDRTAANGSDATFSLLVACGIAAGSYQYCVPPSGGALFSGTICTGGHIIPTSNGTLDLGSSSNRWCTVYTSDLSLNNGIGNYTIVEGENDLFLYNNNSCKVFKFIVQEVCPEIAPAKRST
jgi:hypothetical protein